jgi:hypothetical protein
MIRQASKTLFQHKNRLSSARQWQVSQNSQTACFGTAEKSGSVMDAWQKSCYHEMDYTIQEDSTVFEAVEKFSGYDVGALIAVDSQGMYSVLYDVLYNVMYNV